MKPDINEKEDSFHYMEGLYSQIMNQQRDFRNNNLTNLILTYLKEGSVLDIGCGVGFFLLKAKQSHPECYGLEPNNRLSSILRQRGENITIFNLWAEELDNISERFDNITLIDVLEHVERHEDQVRMIYNRLNDDGLLILVVPAHKCLFGSRDIKMGHYRRYSKREIIGLLTSNGFNIIKARHWNMIGFIPYFVSERVRHRELSSSLRTPSNDNPIKGACQYWLDGWFRTIENHINFNFGLSYIVVARKG